MKYGLVPLRNFAEVDDGFFRSAQPMYSYEYAWLKDVAGVKVIINLRSESKHDEHMDHGLQVINIDVKDHREPNVKQVEDYMALVKHLMDNKTPFLIHCEHGHGRTSTFCVLARIAQGWTLEQALEEETERFHYHFRHPVQLQFLNTFINSAQLTLGN